MALGRVRPAFGSKVLRGSLFSIFLFLAFSVSTSIVHAQSADFSLRTVFRGEGLPQGSSDNYNEVNVTSLYAFSGNVGLSATVAPILSNGPTVSFYVPSVNVPSGESANATLTIQPFLAGNYTVTVTGTASGYPSHSVTVSFNIQPPATDVAVLGYRLTFNANPIPGGTLVLTNSFSNVGAALISVTGLTFNLGFGSYVPSTGLPLSLTSGENKVLTMRIMIPLTATLGNQSLVATLEWIYYAPGQGLWFPGPTRYESGSISVSQSPLFGPLGQIIHLSEIITNLSPWLLVGYAIAVMSGTMLVIRRGRKKQKSLRSH